VLTLTDNAATEIRNLVAAPEVPDDAGVRIASAGDGSLTLALTGAPTDGDAVVENAGARVFLDPAAAELLADQALDAGPDAEGQARFTLVHQG
jgi:Fe-S cluster assembly iron-binding protein IscA